MAVAYATDADLLAWIPDASAIPAGQRALALTYAAARIDLDSYSDQATIAHILLAAHLLAVSTGSLGGEGGQVTSKSAGEISIGYAAAPLAPEGLSTTRWGREFTAITRTAIHAPLAI